MTSKVLIFLILTALAFLRASGQGVELLHAGTGVSLRGLSAVSAKVVWVSGEKGTVGRSLDGGKTWNWTTVQGHETRDFRDIEGFSRSVAIIMAIGEPAVILRTDNGGKSWNKVYENRASGMFLDAMEFWNSESGIVVGDPIGGRFFVARTFDRGLTWTDIPFKNLPAADSGETFFAASGTNVRALARDEACFVSGGKKSRLFWKGAPIMLPIEQGTETSGANSVAVFKRKKMPALIAVVGGDFNHKESRNKNCAISKDGGKTWIRPSNLPNGYRSCVEYISERKLITCGLTGVDISMDEGVNWNSISSTGFHACRKSKKGSTVFFAGADGRIGKLGL